MKQIDRIAEMERCLDASTEAVNQLSEALNAYEQNRKSLKKLFDYYGSTNWMKDFEADEAGKLPHELKRGVLSEDTVYDLIVTHHALMAQLSKILANAIESHTV